jgi:hypothetical protein
MNWASEDLCFVKNLLKTAYTTSSFGRLVTAFRATFLQ